jgi:hypothetical protein
MKKNLLIITIFISCFMLIAGCAGSNKIAARKRLMAMSDKELIEHYRMVEMRLVDLDRAKEQSIEDNRHISNNYDDAKYLNQLHHLHIGDTWYELRKEKDLTLVEMRNRGLSPAQY